MYNQSGPADSRKVLSGKDAVLFNGEGVMLATVESFQVQVNVSNSDIIKRAWNMVVNDPPELQKLLAA